MRGDEENQGIDFTLVYFAWGAVAALVLTLLPINGPQIHPQTEAIIRVLPWLIPVVIILVIPPSIAVMWGATILSPGTLGILFMTEIAAGTATAALWANEAFGMREIIGIFLIVSAGLWEPINTMSKIKK
jgi:drug/metabolite transporter (DMT)-like permease